MDIARYRTLYLAPIASAPRAREAAPPLPALDERNFYLKEGEVEVVPLSLTELYVAGVECGHTAARGELKHQIGTVHQQLTHLREDFDALQERSKGDKDQLANELVATQRRFHKAQAQISEMQVQAGQVQRYAEQVQLQSEQMFHHATHLETSLDVARSRIDELETSRAWRMTAPIRNAGHRAKVARAKLNAWRAGVRRLPQMSVMAWSMLRSEGPVALVHRVRSKVVPEERFKPSAEVQFEIAGGDHAACVRTSGSAGRVDRHSRVRQADADVHVPQERAREHAITSASRSSSSTTPRPSRWPTRCPS